MSSRIRRDGGLNSDPPGRTPHPSSPRDGPARGTTRSVDGIIAATTGAAGEMTGKRATAGTSTKLPCQEGAEAGRRCSLVTSRLLLLLRGNAIATTSTTARMRRPDTTTAAARTRLLRTTARARTRLRDPIRTAAKIRLRGTTAGLATTGTRRCW